MTVFPRAKLKALLACAEETHVVPLTDPVSANPALAPDCAWLNTNPAPFELVEVVCIHAEIVWLAAYCRLAIGAEIIIYEEPLSFMPPPMIPVLLVILLLVNT